MNDLANQSFATLLDEVARATPAPGGGSSAACACALGAALVEMAGGIEQGRAGLPAGLPDRLRELRGQALELAEAELSSYVPVLEARRLAADDSDREARLAEALVQASRTPLAVAEVGAEVAELGARVAEAADPSVRGDAVAGVLLAEAAVVAAALLVEVNLKGQPDSEALVGARAARDRAAAFRSAARAALGRPEVPSAPGVP